MTSLSKVYNASELFIKALENEGVEFIYGVPGEENLDLLESIRKSNIKLILNRHEQAAAFMAATYGRLTGKIGVAISTLGPGATNFTTAAAYATLGGFPLLLITGQKPIKKSKQGRFQIIDVVEMMKPITKFSKQIVDVNMVTSTIREAIKIAESEKPGAVHIEFPEDVSAELVTKETKGFFNINKIEYPEGSDKAIKEAASAIKYARLPLVLIGSAGNRQNNNKCLTDFINNTRLPFFCTQMAKGAIPEDNENYIGTAALSSCDYLHELIKKSDLIVNIGYDVVEKPPYFVENTDVKIIHINYLAANSDNIYDPSMEIIGSISNIVDKLGKELGRCTHDFSYVYKVRDFIKNHIKKYESDNNFPVKPQKIVLDINKILSKDGYVSLDNGMYKLWFARNYITLNPNSLILDNALATMGAGLPAAMEIAKLHPNKKVLAVVGDGGFMMNSQELETAVRLKLNLVVLILNDSSYGMIRWKQCGMGFDDYGLEFNNPDFIKYAESYGAKGHTIKKTNELIPLIEKCFTEKGIHIIDLPIDYSENKKVFIDELANKEKI